MINQTSMFDDKAIVNGLIPPIAEAWENMLTVSERADLFNHLLYTYEALLKSLTSVAYARVYQYSFDLSGIENTLRVEFAQPSLGSWWKLLKGCLKALTAEGDNWANNVSRCLRKKLSSSCAMNVCCICKELQGLQWHKGSASINELMMTMIELRNRTKGHGAVRRGFYKSINDDLRSTLAEMIHTFGNTLQDTWYVVEATQHTSDGKQACKMRAMFGVRKKLVTETVDTDTILLDGKLYMFDQDSLQPWIGLSPLSHWEDAKEDVYFYNQFTGENRAEFLSYTSGDVVHLEYKSFDDLFGGDALSRMPQRSTTPVRESETGVVYNLPVPDWLRFIPRQEFEDEIIRKLSHPRLYITTLDGIGGCGKTSLVLKVAYDIANSEPSLIGSIDYIVWVTAKRTLLGPERIEVIEQQLTSLDDLLKEILRVTGFDDLAKRQDIDFLEQQVFEILSMANFLIIIDNLETVSDADRIWDFLTDPRFAAPTKAIVTSRHRQARAELVVNVRGMTEKQVGDLAESEFERLGYDGRSELTTDLLQTLITRTGAIPLAVKQVIAHAAKGIGLKKSIERLPDRPDNVLDFCFPESFTLLSDNARFVFFTLAKIGEPIGRNELIFITDFSDEELNQVLFELTTLSLIEGYFAGDRYYLLPLTQKFAEREISRHIDIEERILSRLEEFYELRQATALAVADGPVTMAGIATADKMLQLGVVCAERGAFDKAEFWFEKAITADPSNPYTWFAKARYEYRDKQDVDEARNSFAEASRLSQDDPEILIGWAHMERTDKKWEKATELFNKVLDSNPNQKYALHGRGLTLLEKGVTQKEHGKRQSDTRRIRDGQEYIRQSVPFLRKALFDEPSTGQAGHHNAVTYYVLSRAYSRLAKLDEAILACDRALELEPYNSRVKNWIHQLRVWRSKDE